MLLIALTGWLERGDREAIAYLMEENRLLRRPPSWRRRSRFPQRKDGRRIVEHYEIEFTHPTRSA
jgi:hypothetical protein